jgi:hypothetical protein
MDFIPYNTPEGGTEIHTASLAAGTKATFAANKAIYAHVLYSVQWKDAGK